MKTIILSIFYLTVLSINAQHSWVRTNAGGGGAIATVGATASGIILAASDLSGVYRSTDEGQTWDVVGANQGLLETHISSFGFDPNDGDIFFTGTYTGAYKTIDGGDNFTPVFPGSNNNFDYSYVEDIVIAKSNSNIGYITHHISPESSGEVYKTIDGGETWNEIVGEDLPDDLHLIKLMVHPASEDIVYVLTGKSRWGCSEANLYRSTNGGVTWTEIGANKGDILDVDLHPTNSNIVFMSTFESFYIDNESCKELSLEEYFSDEPTAGEFYKSTNGGDTFIEIGDKTGIISVGIDNPDVIRLMDVLLPYEWNDITGTWETTNGGTTWTHTGFRENWNQGYTENEFYAYAHSFNGLNKTVTKDIFNSDRFYGSYGQWAWGSFDGGVTFNNISTKEISTNHWLSTGVENINGHALDINENNPNVVYIGGYDIGFWYTTDHGNSWTRTQPDFNMYPEYSWNLGTGVIEENMAKRGAGANVMTILNDPDPSREGVVWASFSREQLTDPLEDAVAETGLFKSINYGEDWELISDGLPSFSQSIRMYGLSMDVNSDSTSRTMYLTVNEVVYRSTNDGITWQIVLEDKKVKFTEVDKFNGTVYAGGKDGLWRSTNLGDSWIEVGTAAMHNFNTDVRPDIVPTWTDWSGANPVYPWEGVFDIQTDPNNADGLYVTVLGPNGGLYHSTDAGNSWSDNLLPDTHLRGVAIAPQDSNIIYATSSMSYHSGGFDNSLGILFSTDAGITWHDANNGMAYNYGGIIEIETGVNPSVWAWSPGTGMQKAEVNTTLNVDENSLNVIIYPNPTIGKITVPNEFFNAEYEIISIDGRVLLKDNTKLNQIDLSNLKTGIYFIKLNNKQEGISKSIRVIKK